MEPQRSTIFTSDHDENFDELDSTTEIRENLVTPPSLFEIFRLNCPQRITAYLMELLRDRAIHCLEEATEQNLHPHFNEVFLAQIEEECEAYLKTIHSNDSVRPFFVNDLTILPRKCEVPPDPLEVAFETFKADPENHAPNLTFSEYIEIISANYTILGLLESEIEGEYEVYYKGPEGDEKMGHIKKNSLSLTKEEMDKIIEGDLSASSQRGRQEIINLILVNQIKPKKENNFDSIEFKFDKSSLMFSVIFNKKFNPKSGKTEPHVIVIYNLIANRYFVIDQDGEDFINIYAVERKLKALIAGIDEQQQEEVLRHVFFGRGHLKILAKILGNAWEKARQELIEQTIRHVILAISLILDKGAPEKVDMSERIPAAQI